MVYSRHIVVLSKADIQYYPDMDEFKELKKAQILELCRLVSDDVSTASALDMLTASILAGGIVVETSKGRIPSAAVRALINGPWTAFARQLLQHLITYGVCVCSMSKHGEPNVLPLQDVDVRIRVDPCTGQRDYRVVLGESIKKGKSSRAGFRMPAPTIQETALTLLDDSLLYLFEEYPPSKNGALTSPLRSIIPVEKVVKHLTNDMVIAAARRAVPTVFVESDGKAPSSGDVNAQGDFAHQGDLQRAQLDAARGFDEFQAAALDVSMAKSRAQADALLAEMSAERSKALNELVDRETESVTFPAGKISAAHWFPMIRLPPGHKIGNNAAAVPAVESDAQTEADSRLEIAIAKVLGIPRAMFSAQSGKITDSVNQVMLNLYASTQNRWRDVLVFVLKLLMERVFGPDLDRFGTSKNASGSSSNKKRGLGPLMSVAPERVRRKVEEGVGGSGSGLVPFSSAKPDAGMHGMHNPKAVRQPNFEGSGKTAKVKKEDGEESSSSSSDDEDGSEEEDPQDNVDVIEKVDAEELEDVEEFSVVLPGLLDPIVSRELFELGAIDWETYLLLAPHRVYGLQWNMLQKKRLDAMSGKPAADMLERDRKDQFALASTKGAGSAAGGAGKQKKPGAVKPPVVPSSKPETMKGTSPGTSRTAQSMRRGSSAQQSSASADKRKTTGDRASASRV